MANPSYYLAWPSFKASLIAADAADYDGSGTPVLLVSGPTSGSRDIFTVQIIPRASITKGNLIRFYKFFSGGGSVHVPPDFPLPRFVLDADIAIPPLFWTPLFQLTLATGDSLKFGEQLADNPIDGHAYCGDK